MDDGDLVTVGLPQRRARTVGRKESHHLNRRDGIPTGNPDRRATQVRIDPHSRGKVASTLDPGDRGRE